MKQFKIGDRVCIRGLIQSDCVGLTGTIIEMRQSALFGPKVQRCKVDFKGKRRQVLSLHLNLVADRDTSSAAA